MKKIFSTTLVLVLLTSLLAGCGNAADPMEILDNPPVQIAAPSDAQIVFKLGTGGVPGHPNNYAATEFARLLYEKSGHRMAIDLYFNMMLGSDAELLDQCSNDLLDMCIGGYANYVPFVPELALFDMPFLFKSPEHVQKVLDSGVLKQFEELVEKTTNVVELSLYESGWRMIYTIDKPVLSPADLKGVKIRTQASNAYIDMYTACGALPVPMATAEIYTALQQRTIDAVDNGIYPIYASRYTDFGGNIMITNHGYGFAPLVMSKAKWDKLSPEDQQLLKECAEAARPISYNIGAKLTEKYCADIEATTETKIYRPGDFDVSELDKTMSTIYPKYEETFGELGVNIIRAIQKLAE